MDCRLLAADGVRSGAPKSGDLRPQLGRLHTWPGRRSSDWGLLLTWALLALLLLGCWPAAAAMSPGHVRELRQETVDMFYHGFDNYMNIAFPEDEV